LKVSDEGEQTNPLFYSLKKVLKEIKDLEILVNKAKKAEPVQVCREDENFVQMKFGYCFYTLSPCPFLYNLYVYPEYRRQGHSRELLKMAIFLIRENGYAGDIKIEVRPREGSIEDEILQRYYESLGLVIYPPEE